MHPLRRHLVPLLLMLPVMFVCGKLLLTPVNVEDVVMGVPSGSPPPNIQEYDRGWPWVFVHQYEIFPSATRLGRMEIKGLWLGKLLADLIVLFAMAAIACVAIKLLYDRSRGSVQFSLRSLLTIVTIAALCCGWWMFYEREQRQEERAWDELSSSYSMVEEEIRYCGPEWLLRFASEDALSIFYRITELQIRVELNNSSGELPPDLVERLGQFGDLRKIAIYNTLNNPLDGQHPHLRISNTEPLRRIEELEFDECTADDETLKAIAHLPCLKVLKIISGVITQQGIGALERCKSLETLAIEQFRLVRISRLPVLDRLVNLSLKGIELEVAAIDDLIGMKSLVNLDVSMIETDDRVVRRLVVLPNLQTLRLETDRRLAEETIQFLEKHVPYVSAPSRG